MGESILLSEKIQYYLQDMFATMKNVNIKFKKAQRNRPKC